MRTTPQITVKMVSRTNRVKTVLRNKYDDDNDYDDEDEELKNEIYSYTRFGYL